MKQHIIEVKSILNELASDFNISKSIRQKAVTVIRILDEDNEIAIKCDKAIQTLNIDETPNIDMFTKTRIWSLLSMLESISKL
jgi:uncharacterized protein (UPF0147 family)